MAKKEYLRSILTKEMEKEHNGENSSNVADFALRFKIGGVRFEIDNPCHAMIRWSAEARTEGEELTDIALYLKSWYRRVPDESKKTYIKYVQWILKSSPWASCFKTKTASIAIEKGVTMNTDKNISELMGAAIALREGWEFAERLPMFQYCLDIGTSYETAYLMGQAAKESVNKEAWHKNTMSSAHSAINGDMDWDALLEFFRSGYEPGLKGMRFDKTQNSYQVFDTITSRADRGYFETKEKDRFSTHLFAVTNPIIIGDGWMRKERITAQCIANMIELLETEMKKGKK